MAIHLHPLLILGTFWGNVSMVVLGLAAITGFLLGWWFSTLLIPPRDYWRKSAIAIFLVKIGIGLTAGYLAVIGTAWLITAVFG